MISERRVGLEKSAQVAQSVLSVILSVEDFAVNLFLWNTQPKFVHNLEILSQKSKDLGRNDTSWYSVQQREMNR